MIVEKAAIQLASTIRRERRLLSKDYALRAVLGQHHHLQPDDELAE
jgi:hypothetical protein